MKRLMLAVMMVSAIGALGSAHASCARAGEYDQATVSFKTADNHTVSARLSQYGNGLGVGPAQACDDTSAGVTPLYSEISFKVDGATVCTRALEGARVDPFVFGGNSHSLSGGACGGNLDWGTLNYPGLSGAPANLPFVPDPALAGVDPNGVTYVPGYTWVVPVTGYYWGLAGTADEGVPDNTLGIISHGVGATVA